MNNASSTAPLTRDQKQYIRMTTEPVGPLVVKMAVPMIISMLVTSIYNIADTYFVASLGTSAAGAVASVLPLMSIIQAVGFTLGMGSGAQISRLLGEKNKDRSESVAICALVSAFVFGLCVSCFGLVFSEQLLRLMGATDTILPYSQEYVRYILIAAPVMAATFVLNNLLRCQGKAKFAMIGVGSGALLNIGLDPLFIFVFNMGIRGAALATAVSQCVGFSVLLSMFIFKKSVFDLKFSRLTHVFTTLLSILKHGLASFVRQGAVSIATVILNRAASVYGDAPFAAMTIVTKVFMIIFSIGLGIGQGYMPVVGYNYGARRFDRVRKSFRFTFFCGTGLMTVLSALMFVFAPAVLSAFVSDDPAVGTVGAFALRAQCVAMPFLALGVVCNMTFQTIGRSWLAAFLSSLRQGIYFIPLLLILPRYIGLLGVETAQAAADILTFFTCIPYAISFLRSLPKENGAPAGDIPGGDMHETDGGEGAA